MTRESFLVSGTSGRQGLFSPLFYFVIAGTNTPCYFITTRGPDRSGRFLFFHHCAPSIFFFCVGPPFLNSSSYVLCCSSLIKHVFFNVLDLASRVMCPGMADYRKPVFLSFFPMIIGAGQSGFCPKPCFFHCSPPPFF